MKTSAEIILEIENKIAELKKKKVHTFYSISTEITQQTAQDIKNYFKEYSVDSKKCPRGFFDIIISF